MSFKLKPPYKIDNTPIYFVKEKNNVLGRAQLCGSITINDKVRNKAQLREIINMKNNCSWDFNISKIINEGHKIGTPKHLISRINDEEIDKVIMKMEDEKK